ncbi:MAG TPA: hypothetical protein VFG83_04775 [Kofleriaceae bacterium]|nr:hypothetical protein [Kofleriaceae bacterium]
MRPEIGSIRAVRVRKFLVASFAEAETRRFRVRRYSIQKNHLHLICDAKSTEALASGMQGLNIRIARGLNRIMDRRGAVLDGRYHVEILDRGDLARDAVCFFDEKNRPCAGLTEWAEIPDEDRPEHPRP